jgi:hypothetical protein
MAKNVDDAQMGRCQNSGTFVDQRDRRCPKNVAHIFKAEIIPTFGNEAIVVHEADPDAEFHKLQRRAAASDFKNILGLNPTATKDLINGTSGC